MKFLKVLALSSIVASSGAFAGVIFPNLDLAVSNHDDGLLLTAAWGFGNLPQCGSGECITSVSIDLTAGPNESNAIFTDASIVSQTRISDNISYRILDSADPNSPTDNSTANLLSFFFEAGEFDQDNGFRASFLVEGLNNNTASQFYRRGVLASAEIGGGDYVASEVFSQCDYAACASLSFERSVDVPEPGVISLLCAGLAGLGLSRRLKQS